MKETRLSRILAGLLDPSGTHGQGDRFLSFFLKEMLPGDFSCVDITGASTVHLEYPTHEGRRIDIVLKMPGNHWIGIENKPWAEEGEGQVSAYLKFLERKARNGKPPWILYLSGDGSCPDLSGAAKLKNCCITVPYRKNTGSSVEGWVEKCWRECEAEPVRWFLKDLLEYIRRNFNKENQVMGQDDIDKTTVEFILGSRNLALANEVKKAMPQVRHQLITDVKERLAEWCENQDSWKVSEKETQGYALKREGWPLPAGVYFEADWLKVILPPNTPPKEFQSKFENLIECTTNKSKWEGYDVIQIYYDLFGTANQSKSMAKEEIIDGLAANMERWATAVDKIITSMNT